MSDNEFNLGDIFDLPEWGKLLGSLSEAFGVAIGMSDLRNEMVLEPVGESDFCSAVFEEAKGKKLCIKCAALGGLEAMRTGKPFITRCHAGVTFGCVPVMVQNQYMGMISYGQVRVKGEDAVDRSVVINGKRSILPDGVDDPLKARLIELFLKLPETTEKKLQQIGSVIWNLTNYMVDRIVSLQRETRSYERVLQNALTPFIEEPVLKEQEKEKDASFPLPETHQLYPTLVYVEEHLEKAISMHEMADLCKLSHSYFSKIFVRELGENFTDYVAHRKIERAKTLLRESSKGVAQISSELGFSDPSYFIKVFKKHEKTTPLSYRQYKFSKKTV